MATKAGTTAIYPTGWGRFALTSPDGPVLRAGCELTVLVAGYQITGTVQASTLGDYLQLPDGGRCGLCAGMSVVAVPNALSLAEQIKAAYYDASQESELRLARLTKQAMETMPDEEWKTLCAALVGSGVAR